jgi:hypothetical protein
MIKVNWSKDDRHQDPRKYLVDPDSSNESRWLAFTRGWTRYINQGARPESDMVTWWETGMFCASVLGDLDPERRRLIYKVLLAQFLSGDRTEDWTDAQREEALSLI